MKRLVMLASLLLAAPLHAEEWVGWIVGEPCAAALQVADCPLRHVDQPVLLTEDGRRLLFVSLEGKALSPADVDKSYAKKVRVSGELRDGVIQPIKLDPLETGGEKKFFKGCL
jgi:hypothetical protein